MRTHTWVSFARMMAAEMMTGPSVMERVIVPVGKPNWRGRGGGGDGEGGGKGGGEGGGDCAGVGGGRCCMPG